MRKYTTKQIKEAFWLQFHKSGQIMFTYKGTKEENISSTQQQWDKFLEILEAKEEDKIPTPCPFCGRTPKILLQAESKGGAWGKIACTNPQCPVQPEICDDRRVTEVEDPTAYKDIIITLWNKRAKC